MRPWHSNPTKPHAYLFSGIGEEDARCLCQHIIERCPSLRMKGLMTVASFDPSRSPECFRRLANLRSRLFSEFKTDDNEEEWELSMGMSADMEEAIRWGSSELRLGTAIFGQRPSTVK
eukprot:GHVU01103900.1.p1 GENE.GHVU01103900.1~~GHVU01103900.1.p1  ORF type:complete len:118 (+),score=10.36 GHVU01103900.1:1165-1518(+)